MLLPIIVGRQSTYTKAAVGGGVADCVKIQSLINVYTPGDYVGYTLQLYPS